MTVADLAKPRDLRHDRFSMGQLRTANKRRKRAILATQDRKALPVAVPDVATAPDRTAD